MKILSWLFIVTLLDRYPSWFSSRRHGLSVYGRFTGYDHTLPLGAGMAVTVEVLPCGSCKPQYGGLLFHKRIYEIKEEKENGEGIEKYIEMRNSWS